MYLRILKLLIFFLMPVTAFAQYAPVTQGGAPVSNADAVFASIQAQQNFMLQQQQQQVLAQQQALIAQQQEMARNAQIQSLMGVCAQSLSGSGLFGKSGNDMEELAYATDDAAYAAREQEGWVTDPDLDSEVAGAVGADASAQFAVGCNNFINSSGQLGPWGSYALAQIKTKPQSFGANVPTDLTTWCPKYPSMTQSQRELYWVWILMSMAASESSCNPAAKNPNAPNGTAVGLFQVWKPVCPKSRNLERANENIQCAVDLLADEMQDRSTLMTPTSKGKAGTYWGPLRSDDWNKARGGDISGAQKTRGLMKQYRYCN